MVDLGRQPFLLSLRQAVDETGDLSGYETLLHEQYSAFKVYLREICNSDIPAQKRYEFLQTADYEVCHIRSLYADKIRKKDLDFYHFWSMMIVDTRRYINVGIKTLEFQKTLPEHMLVAPVQTFPDYKWTAKRRDLTEVMVGLYEVDVIRLKDGRRPPFALFAKFIGNFFGIEYPHPHVDMDKVIKLKKNQTPFLERIISCIKEKNEDKYK